MTEGGERLAAREQVRFLIIHHDNDNSATSREQVIETIDDGTNTQMHKYTYTHIRKYTNTQRGVGGQGTGETIQRL